jgi:hypothetical protein
VAGSGSDGERATTAARWHGGGRATAATTVAGGTGGGRCSGRACVAKCGSACLAQARAAFGLGFLFTTAETCHCK